jgi:hypothetical protein
MCGEREIYPVLTSAGFPKTGFRFLDVRRRLEIYEFARVGGKADIPI